jgi:hypothetical protein
LALTKQRVRIEVSAYASYTPDYGVQRKPPYVASLPILLDEPPDVRLLPLPGKIKAGQPLPAELTARSLSPIAQFDGGLEDPDKPDEFAQEPKKVAVGQVTRDAWSARLPTEKLPAGEHNLSLLFRARNAVGETLVKRAWSLHVVDAPRPPSDGAKPGPKKGRIVGVVAFKNDTKVKCASGTVHLDDADGKGGGRSADIDDDGRFEFDDVPYGRHVLSAKGDKGGVKGQGKLEVELDESTTRPGRKRSWWNNRFVAKCMILAHFCRSCREKTNASVWSRFPVWPKWPKKRLSCGVLPVCHYRHKYRLTPKDVYGLQKSPAKTRPSTPLAETRFHEEGWSGFAKNCKSGPLAFLILRLLGVALQRGPHDPARQGRCLCAW